MAKVYDYVLRVSQFERMMPTNLSQEDSLHMADQIINDWIKEKAVLARAENNLLDEKKDFQEKLDDYRNSLVIYTYEKELVNQKLDTVISENEIQTFFNENSESFKLKSSILQLWFMSVSADAPNKRKLKKWFSDGTDEDLLELDDYCNRYAEKCFLSKEDWIYVEDLQKQIALDINDWPTFLRDSNYHEFEIDGRLNIMRVFSHRVTGAAAPLELERQKVENLILNKRKAELVKKMREDALRDAYAKDKVEWEK
ncbi:MAG: hypothetical protein MK086_04875 [Flavobacteriales bacterium]|nr:hypothetical protein [Flavobacteriales bacterium]